jgi:hypothetical protein
MRLLEGNQLEEIYIMLMKSIAVALVSTALMTGAAYSQTATKDRSDTNVAVHRDGE